MSFAITIKSSYIAFSFLFLSLHPAHFPRSSNVCQKDAEVYDICRHANEAKVMQDEIKDVGEPHGSAVSQDGRGQLKFASEAAFPIAGKRRGVSD